MITFAHTVEKLIPLDRCGVRNAATPPKQDKSDVAAVACHFKQPAQIAENPPSLETTAKTVTKG